MISNPAKAAIAALFVLSGCAGYQPSTFFGGLTEVQLDKNLWRVTFRGNGFTSKQKAEDLAMLRSAELTLQSGFRYFFFVSSKWSNSRAYIQTGPNGQMTEMTKPSKTNTVFMAKTREEIGKVAFDAQLVCSSLGKFYRVTCGQQ